MRLLLLLKLHCPCGQVLPGWLGEINSNTRKRYENTGEARAFYPVGRH